MIQGKGLVADDRVTCDQAIEKGRNPSRPTEGNYFSRVVYHRKDKVTPMKFLINNGVNVEKLFNRIIVVMNDEN